MAGSVTIMSGLITDGTGNTKTIQQVISGAGNVIAIQDLTITAAGFTAVTAPQFATCAVVTPPASNLIGLTLKGVTADTGIPVQSNQAFVVTFANPSATNNTFGITAAAAIVGPISVSFF